MVDLQSERVFRRLSQAYGVTDFPVMGPLEVLVGCVVSGAAFARTGTRVIETLRGAFEGDRPGFWERVRDAEAMDVQTALASVSWSENKAHWVQSLLRVISERRRGELSLDFLGKLPPGVALAWLRMLPGVDQVSARRTLALSTLEMTLPPAIDEAGPMPILDWLELSGVWRDWGAKKEEQFQSLLKTHQQKTCFAEAPACERCAVSDLCRAAHSGAAADPRAA